MKIDSNIINSAVEEHFSILKERVDSRLKSSDSLDWLLEVHENATYQPDYLTMGSAGRTRVQQFINGTISRILPAVWFKTFWPKIAKSLISYTEESYYQKIFHGVGNADLVFEMQDQISSVLRALLSRSWDNLTQCTFTELSNCLLAVIHEPLKQLPIEQDIFLPDKTNQNAVCLDLLSQISDSFKDSENRLESLAYLCCRSNWIDSLEDDVAGLLERFVGEITANWSQGGILKNMPSDSDFFQLKYFKRLINTTTGPILYESDNCGEIIFDLCLIEEFISQGRTVYLCVKEVPMVNDAMEKDVLELLNNDQFSGLKSANQEGRLKLVTAGAFPGGGKLVHEINDIYRDAFIDSDLVIIKGQGNFQSMPMRKPKFGRLIPYRYKKPVIFMTGIKAEMIQMCLTSLFPKHRRPPKNSLYLFVFDKC